ncbi:hypothetical protein MTR67_002987 [Solanum verrucosum]|uniref:Uncharacterized protein n=1 Tax=Solanum verrucosum TaxID=315347 RepID=A0AAF0PS15_SOLVR|nr:hypothetical protein MTR67_002987 [Solanum verrucosum]
MKQPLGFVSKQFPNHVFHLRKRSMASTKHQGQMRETFNNLLEVTHYGDNGGNWASIYSMKAQIVTPLNALGSNLKILYSSIVQTTHEPGSCVAVTKPCSFCSNDYCSQDDDFREYAKGIARPLLENSLNLCLWKDNSFPSLA